MVTCVLRIVGVRVLDVLEGSVPPRSGVRQVWSRDATELPRTMEKVSTTSYLRSLYRATMSIGALKYVQYSLFVISQIGDHLRGHLYWEVTHRSVLSLKACSHRETPLPFP